MKIKLLILTLILITGCSNPHKDNWKTVPIINKFSLQKGFSYIVPQDETYNFMFYSETEVDKNMDNKIQILQDGDDLVDWRDN